MRMLFGGLGVLLVAPLLLWLGVLLNGSVLPNVRVAGVVLPDHDVRGFLAQRAREWGEQSLLVETGVHRFSATHRELGAGRSVEAAWSDVRDVGRQINPLLSLGAMARSLWGQGTNVPWQGRIVDETALDRFAHRLRAEIDRPPVPGTFDVHGQPVPGMPGETLDVSLLKRAIRRAVREGKEQLHVPTLVTPPPRTMARAVSIHPGFGASRQLDESVLMMRQETYYKQGSSGRAVNIELAARKLDGQVIAPNDVLSFNDVVGKRTVARGFQPATELRNGEVVDGIGGGVCQAAGTLHAAAFFAGFAVEEYQPHSRLNRFAYLRPGLDTMVAWPDNVGEADLERTRDLKIRNPYPFSIVVRTAILSNAGDARRMLRVDLRGAARAFRVDWSFKEVGRVPAGERRRVDGSLSRGQERVKQRGLDGLIISRQRLIYKPTGIDQEVQRVAYPPTPRVILYGG